MNAAMDLLQARAGDQLATLRRVQQELAAVSASRSVDDGRVRVTLDAAGCLVGLELQAGAGAGDADRLAALIVEAAAEAGREVVVRLADLTADFMAEFGPETITDKAGEEQ